MRKLSAAVGAGILGLAAAQADAAIYTGNLTIVYGDTSSDGLPLGAWNGAATPTFFDAQFSCQDTSMTALGFAPNFCFVGNFDSTGDKGWAAAGPNSISLVTSGGPPASNVVTNALYSQKGNGTSYYNPRSQFDGALNETGIGQSNCTASTTLNDFSCTATVGKSTILYATAVTDVGPSAVATGAVTIDTVAGTLTGSLSVSPYVYRFADGSPFPNGADYVGYYAPGATLALNFTGSFSDTSWSITGGSASFNDPGFACFGGGVLCNDSAVLGGHQSDGSHFSWIPVPVYNGKRADGGTLQFTIPAILASASLSGGPTTSITTSSGEFRRGIGSTGTGNVLGVSDECGTWIAYNGTSITCGTLTVGKIVSMAGTFELQQEVIPVPAAVWLFGSAVGLLGWARRRSA